MQPQVSVIMPIYNTGKYLKESISSVLQQTYKDFELICVNDASIDTSQQILEEFQKKDSRILIICHERNCGAAISRNDGLKIARGEYVIFLDSDDYFYPNMLEDSYIQAVQYSADVVILGSEMVTKKSQEAIKMYCTFEVIDNLEGKERFLPMVRHVPWDKLVKKEILAANNIMFQDVLTNNDIFYSLSTVLMANRIVVYDKVLLKYRYGRDGSLTEVRRSQKNCIVEAFYAIYLFCVNRNIDRCLITVFINMLADNIQRYLSNEEYPLEIRQKSLNILLGHQDLIAELSQKLKEGLLYPHNRCFVEKLIREDEVCGIEYMQYYVEGLNDIIYERRNQSKKVALWGCGQRGKELLDLIENMHIYVDYVVDENSEIWGNRYGRYVIDSFEQKKDDIDTIFITNLNYKQDIEIKADGREIIYVWK